MPDLVRITDVSPRDGLQNEAGAIPTDQKARLVELLSETGVDEVEVTSFVSKKWVPQLGDATELCGLLSKPLPEGGVGAGEADAAAAPRWRPPPRQEVTLERARDLRNRMTGPECRLWYILRERKNTGYKFRRQHPFGPYILDYFCHELLLAIEVDGISHEGSEAYDERRDLWIRERGVRVVRISSDTVLNAPAVALQVVKDAIAMMEEDGLLGGVSTSKALPTPTPPSGRGIRRPVYSALVPNAQGLASALSLAPQVLSKLSVFTAASETFAQKNTNATIAQTLERFAPVVAGAKQHDLALRGYISCVIACPFEGPIAPAAVRRVADQLWALGVDEIDLGDTIGAGDESSTRALLHEFRDWPEGRAGQPGLTLHLHDTFGKAASCVRVALDAGIRSFDGSVAGLGGCPYASTPDRRAPGNISTELLVRTVHEAGHDTDVDLDALETAATFARDIVAKSRLPCHRPLP